MIRMEVITFLPALLRKVQTLPSLKSCSQRWKLETAHGERFEELACFDRFYSSMSIDEVNAYICEELLAAAKVAIPQTSGRIPKQPKAWWNDACRESRKKQNKAWGVFRRHPTLENCLSFKAARAAAQKVRKVATKNSWQSFVSAINTSTPAKKVWDHLRKIKGNYRRFSMPLFSTDGASNLLETQADAPFAEVSSDKNYTKEFLEHIKEFTLYELKRALAQCKATSVGPDLIHCAFLQYLSDGCLEAILEFFNKIWKTGTV